MARSAASGVLAVVMCIAALQGAVCKSTLPAFSPPKSGDISVLVSFQSSAKKAPIVKFFEPKKGALRTTVSLTGAKNVQITDVAAFAFSPDGTMAVYLAAIGAKAVQAIFVQLKPTGQVVARVPISGFVQAEGEVYIGGPKFGTPSSPNHNGVMFSRDQTNLAISNADKSGTRKVFTTVSRSTADNSCIQTFVVGMTFTLHKTTLMRVYERIRFGTTSQNPDVKTTCNIKKADAGAALPFVSKALKFVGSTLYAVNTGDPSVGGTTLLKISSGKITTVGGFSPTAAPYYCGTYTISNGTEFYSSCGQPSSSLIRFSLKPKVRTITLVDTDGDESTTPQTVAYDIGTNAANPNVYVPTYTSSGTLSMGPGEVDYITGYNKFTGKVASNFTWNFYPLYGKTYQRRFFGVLP